MRVEFQKSFQPQDCTMNMRELRDALEPLVSICEQAGYRGPQVGWTFREGSPGGYHVDKEINRFFSGEVCITSYSSFSEQRMRTVVAFPASRTPDEVLTMLRGFYAPSLQDRTECEEEATLVGSAKTF